MRYRHIRTLSKFEVKRRKIGPRRTNLKNARVKLDEIDAFKMPKKFKFLIKIISVLEYY